MADAAIENLRKLHSTVNYDNPINVRPNDILMFMGKTINAAVEIKDKNPDQWDEVAQMISNIFAHQLYSFLCKCDDTFEHGSRAGVLLGYMLNVVPPEMIRQSMEGKKINGMPLEDMMPFPRRYI